ncbi:hypothetical protein GCM10022214_04020 [Actinomadura miaoliensis]|uniref:Uncharacterized protein n=2 Tax=Actinomadura miaoliensis TaxID=430685 RepID=A0ABP7UYY0_9ACTN
MFSERDLEVFLRLSLDQAHLPSPAVGAGGLAGTGFTEAAAREVARVNRRRVITSNLAVALVGLRALARDLARDIALRRNLTRVPGRVDALASNLTLAADLARCLPSAHPNATMVAGLRNARDTFMYARQSAGRGPLFDSALIRARDDSPLLKDNSAQVLRRELDAIRINVSGIDLPYGLDGCDVELFVNFVWSRRTRWPTGLYSQIQACSTREQPGGYQVVQSSRAHSDHGKA